MTPDESYYILFYLNSDMMERRVIKIKSRKQKAKIYAEKYKDIPRDYLERLDWMYNKYHLTLSKASRILQIRRDMMDTIHFEKEFFMVLYEEPEGTPRPRARLIHELSSIKSNPSIQVYSLTGSSDRVFMKKLIEDQEIQDFSNHLIYTPCYVDYKSYQKTPSFYNTEEIYLAELGLIRPISKPDFDNIEKKYADMYNSNVWLDDMLVVDAHIGKYYSILPRVEITLHYLNMLYNKHQFKSIQPKVDHDVLYYNSKERVL